MILNDVLLSNTTLYATLPTVQGRVTAKSNAHSAKASSSNEASASNSKLASGRAPAPAKAPPANRKAAKAAETPISYH